MYQLDLTGKNILILGIANHRSIAWAIAESLDNAGARLVIPSGMHAGATGEVDGYDREGTCDL